VSQKGERGDMHADVNNVRENGHEKPEKRGMGDDIDSYFDVNLNFYSEYDEDVSELLSAHECEVVDNFSELPFCVSQKSERGDMHEEAEKREVVDDINSEGEHNNEKTVETQEHEKPEKRDGASGPSITYHTRQSSTKTEAVLRYVDFPSVNQFMQLVTPLPNPGLEKLEKRDVMTNINPEGGYDNGKMVDKQVHKQPEKRDVMVDFNPKGKHDDEKTEEKKLY
jgi:hypothetical protein